MPESSIPLDATFLDGWLVISSVDLTKVRLFPGTAVEAEISHTEMAPLVSVVGPDAALQLSLTGIDHPFVEGQRVPVTVRRVEVDIDAFLDSSGSSDLSDDEIEENAVRIVREVRDA